MVDRPGLMPGAKRPDPDAPKPPVVEVPAEPEAEEAISPGPKNVVDVLGEGIENACEDVGEGVQFFVQKPLELSLIHI